MMNTENTKNLSIFLSENCKSKFCVWGWSDQINNIWSHERYCIFLRKESNKINNEYYNEKTTITFDTFPNVNAKLLLTVYCWPRLPSPQPGGTSSPGRWEPPSAGEEEGQVTPSHSDSEELPDSDMPSGSLGPAQPEHIRSCNGAGKVSSVDNNKFANKIFFLN